MGNLAINRRTFIIGATAAAVGGALLTALINTRREPAEILRAELKEYTDRIHAQLKLESKPENLRGISKQQSQRVYDDLYKIIKNFQLRYDPEGKLDISDPLQSEANTQQYLLKQGILFSPFLLTNSGNPETAFIPLIRLYEVHKEPSGSINGTTFDLYSTAQELTKALDPDFFPEASGMTLRFNDAANAIVINQQRIAHDVAMFRSAGIPVKAQEYYECMLNNEIASVEFADRFKHKFAKDQKIQLIKSSPEGFSYQQINEAYADMKSFKADSTFPAVVLRILGSPIPNYELSKVLLRTAIKLYNFNQSKNPAGQLDLNNPGLLASRLAQEPEIAKNLFEIVLRNYQTVFNRNLIPEINFRHQRSK